MRVIERDGRYNKRPTDPLVPEAPTRTRLLRSVPPRAGVDLFDTVRQSRVDAFRGR